MWHMTLSKCYFYLHKLSDVILDQEGLNKTFSNINTLKLPHSDKLIFLTYRFLVFNVEIFGLRRNDMHIDNFSCGVNNLQRLYMLLVNFKSSEMNDCRFCQDTCILWHFRVYFWKKKKYTLFIIHDISSLPNKLHFSIQYVFWSFFFFNWPQTNKFGLYFDSIYTHWHA